MIWEILLLGLFPLFIYKKIVKILVARKQQFKNN